jgi:hypothetical protein
VQPVIDFSLALEALDVTKIGARIVSLDLPLVLGDALVFEFDSGFAHAAVMATFSWRGQQGCSSRPARPASKGADMTAHIPESASAWLVGASMMPPRDPNDDDDEGENGEDESEDDEPAVIREPDDE